MALLYAAHRAGWSLRSCRGQRGVCMPSETEGKRVNKTVGTMLQKICVANAPLCPLSGGKLVGTELSDDRVVFSF